METILLVTTLMALFGAYLNSIGNVKGFYIWIVTNLIFAIHNYMIYEYSQMILFLSYLIISVNGIFQSKN